MHAWLARLVVVIEMSWADSLSDAVSQRVHFGITHPEYQLTKAATETTTLTQRRPNARKCCFVCSCVAL